MINKILQNRVYIGDLIQEKKKVESCTHKLISTSKDEWIITENHHKPIISKDKFDKVQEINLLELIKKKIYFIEY